MKLLEFKFGKERINGRDTFFSTPDLLKVAINNVPREGGLDVKEMSTRLRLLKIVDAYPEFAVDEKDFNESHLSIKQTVEIEDADFVKIKELFGQVKWSIISNFIIELDEELSNSKSKEA
jgi:hypothetical protein